MKVIGAVESKDYNTGIYHVRTADGRLLKVADLVEDDQKERNMVQGYLQNIKTGGGQPRFLTESPDGSQIIAANETTDTLTVFDVDPESGRLTVGESIATESPVCLVFKTK